MQVEYGWFADGWAALVAGMQELYPEGNPPTGLLANAWLVPPCMAADPASPMLLPAEDPALGAPNLGCSWGRRPGQGLRNWAAEFRNAEQQLRDPEDILKPSTAKVRWESLSPGLRVLAQHASWPIVDPWRDESIESG